MKDDLPNIKLNRADHLWWNSFSSSFPGWFAVWVWPYSLENMTAWCHCLSVAWFPILHEGWSSKHQAQQSWSLVMKFLFVFFSRLICSVGLALFFREHDSMMSLLECCLISHSAWRMIFQTSSSTELITCDEILFRLLFPADLQCGFGPILERTWQHDVTAWVLLDFPFCMKDDLPNIKLNRADHLWWNSFSSSFPADLQCGFGPIL